MRSAIMLHSKTFDPKAYLATVHPNAAFKDLSRGRENVKDALEQRSEALKVLVEAEFDRFVGVKAATEGVYQEMKQGPLASGSDYGVSSLKTTLKGEALFLSYPWLMANELCYRGFYESRLGLHAHLGCCYEGDPSTLNSHRL